MKKSNFTSMKKFLSQKDCQNILDLNMPFEYRYYLEKLNKNVNINSIASRLEFKKLSQSLLSPYASDVKSHYVDTSPLARYCSFSQYLVSQNTYQNLFIGWASTAKFKKLLNLTHMMNDFHISHGHTFYEQLIKDSVVFNNWDNFKFLCTIEPSSDSVKNFFLSSNILSTAPGILTPKLFMYLINNAMIDKKEQEKFRLASKKSSPHHYIKIEQIYLNNELALSDKEKINLKSIKL